MFITDFFKTNLALKCFLILLFSAFIAFAVVFALVGLDGEDDTLVISVGHLNDFHARFEETSASSSASACKDATTCVGGLARVYTVYKKLRESENFIFLNAGDNFQGTLWFNLFNWNVTQQFMNMFKFDAYTIGNHEFDNFVDGLVPFIKSIRAPTVVCNIDDSKEPTLQNTYNKSTIVWRNGKKIGIIGVILATTNQISNTGNLKFYDEIESINKEAKRLVDEEGVFTNIVLSHCGYSVEKKIAENVGPKVSLVVGAHSHSLLYNGKPPSGTAVGDYPTVIKNKNGDTVLVVQASAYTQYLGNITITYDKSGKVRSWEGAPIYLEHNITPDPTMVKELAPWKETVHQFGDKVLGVATVDLNNHGCYTGECILGDVITDAMVDAWKDYKDKEDGAWSYVSLATMNSGGIRSTIQKGNITYNDIVTAQPFGNTFDCGDLQGKYVREFLEFSTKPYDNQRSFSDIYIPQVSGIKVVFDLSKPYGQRVTSLQLLCQNCPAPLYEEVDDEKMYRIVVPSFMSNGGDGFVAISDNIKNLKIGIVDIQFYIDYIPKVSPITQALEGRIEVIGKENVRMFMVP